MSLTLKIKNLKKLTLVAITALCASTTAVAQDRMAALAPSDVKMKSVDTLMLHNLRKRENAAAPSNNLYEEWNNRSVSQHNQAIPETYTVDLRNFAMPTKNRVVTSGYGRRWGRMHKGLDVKVYIGDTIVSAFDGKVRIVRYEPNGYGNYVVIRHNNGLETVYGHLSKQLVRENQEVHAGDVIGLGGNTGRSTGSHLHFETRFLGVAINPALLFDFGMQDVTGDFYTFRKNRAYNMDRTTARRTSNASKNESSEKSGARYHKVHKGETLSTISKKYGLSVQQLCKLNGISTKTVLQVGKVLKCG